MATYEKMVLISEAEYMNLKNYKYLPHEIDGDEESGYDDDDDESGYRPDRFRRQSQAPDDRHIQSSRPSPTSSDTQSSASSARPSSTSARRSIDLTSSDTQSSVSSARSSMSSGDARARMSSGDATARAEAAQRIQEQRI